MAIIDLPILYVPDPTKGKPLAFGQILVGEPDLDPEVVVNQKQLSILQEDGTKVDVGQPFILSAGGVPVYNGSTVRLSVDGNYSLKILSSGGDQEYYIENIFFSATDANTLINVSVYGAVGDGVTDDTEALLLAIDALPDTGGTLIFPTGTYRVDCSSANRISLFDKTNFIIQGNNSTIKALDGVAAVANGQVLFFQDCTDGQVLDLTLDANRANRTEAVTTAHCLHIRNSTKRVHFRNVHCINGVSDGWYADTVTLTEATTPTDITLEDCTGVNCFRNNGTGINTIRFTLIGGAYTGANGNDPQAGFDFEDDGGGVGNVDVLVNRTRFDDNLGEGLQLSGVVGCTDGKVTGKCTFEQNVKSAIKVGLNTGLVIDDVDVGEHTGAVTRGLIDVGAQASTDVTIKNVRFRKTNMTGIATNYNIYVHASSGKATIKDIDIDDTNSIGILLGPDSSTIDGFDIKNSSSGSTGSIVGENIYVRNWYQENISNSFLVNGSAKNCNVSLFYSQDSTATTHFFSNRADTVLENAEVLQTVSIPVGQIAYTFVGAPRIMADVSAKSEGTDFTAANFIEFTGGLVDSTQLTNLSPGFWTNDTLSPDNGDVGGLVFEMGLSERTQVFDTPLTAVRTQTLSTTNAKNGDRIKVFRTLAATGGDNLVINVPSNVVALVPGDWVEYQFDTAWFTSSRGAV